MVGSRRAGAASGVLIAFFLAALVAAILLARPPVPALGDGPSQKALDRLNEVREDLEEAARKADNEDKAKSALNGARQRKEEFIREAFTNTTLLGGCQGSVLIRDLDAIDLRLKKASLSSGDRRERLVEEARQDAQLLLNFLKRCASSSDALEAAKTIKLEIEKLQKKIEKEKDGRLDDKKLKEKAEQVFEQKKRMLRGQTIDGCDVFEFFVLIEKIDVLIAKARDVKPEDGSINAEREAKRKRRGLLEDALSLVTELIRTYRLIPCGPQDDAPPGGDGDGGTPPPPPPPPPPDDDKFGCNVEGQGSAPPPGSPTGSEGHTVQGTCTQPIERMSFQVVQPEGNAYTAFRVHAQPVPDACRFAQTDAPNDTIVCDKLKDDGIVDGQFGTTIDTTTQVCFQAWNAAGDKFHKDVDIE